MYGGGEGKVLLDIELCFRRLLSGGVVFDAYVEVRKLQERAVGYRDAVLEEVPVDSKLRMRFGEQAEPSAGVRMPRVRSPVCVEDPWRTKYRDVKANFDALDGPCFDGFTEVERTLYLPNGQPHAKVFDASIAEICGLPPPKLVTVLVRREAEVLELSCVNMAGDCVGTLWLADKRRVSFRDVRRELLRALGDHEQDSDVRFVTQAGVELTCSQSGTLRSLFSIDDPCCDPVTAC